MGVKVQGVSGSVGSGSNTAEGGVRRGVMGVPRNVLDSFDGLVMDNEKRRTSAAMVILQHVDKVLRAAAAGGESKEIPEGVKYIVNRLVNGLASNRLKAREGYFSALCFLLRLHPASFTPSFILSLLTMKKSAAMKAVTKDEIRDQLLGELLLCGAIVRSGHAGQSREVVQRIMNQLCAMRSKKSYLDITATQFIVNLMESCDGNSVQKEVWESLHTELQSPISDLTPSQLWMRLVLARKHRASPPPWLTSTLAPKNHEALILALMKTSSDLPKVHPVIEEIVSSLAATQHQPSSLLIKFWNTTVEPLQGNTSPAKLQILFHILKFTVPHLRSAKELKEVVTPSIVGLLLNSLTQSAQDLKEAAKGVTTALVQLVEDNQQEESELQLAVVRSLVTPPGSIRFDQLAGHKVIGQMVRHFTLKTIKGFTKTLMEVVNKPMKEVDPSTHNTAAHTIGTLLTQPRASTSEAAPWRKKQLLSLFKGTLITASQGDTSRDAFFKVLGKLVGHIKEYKDILVSLIEGVDKEVKEQGEGEESIMRGEMEVVWSQVISRLADLKRKEEEEEGNEEEIARTVFEVLYGQMALHLFVDITVAKDNVEELTACHREVKKLGILSNNKEEEEEEEEDEEMEVEEGRPSWVEVVTELLLSLMTQEMHLFRCVVQGLMWQLTPLMTATSLTLLTDVLDTEKARQLVKKEGEEEEDEEEEEGESDGEDEEGGDDSDDDDDDDDEGEEGEDANLFTLKKKMFDVAGGDIDVDVDMDSVPQEELDRLDERLGALLAEYKGKHPGRKKKKGRKGGGDSGPQLSAEEQSLMHFQTRVCDMLQVYIKAAPNMALQVALVNPVFKALRAADLDPRQKDLQRKLVSLITTLEKKKKFNIIGDINTDSWKETVEEFFTLGCQMPERFLAVTRSCYSQLMHCGRLLLATDEEALRRPDNFLTTTYVTHLQTFFTENHHMPKIHPFRDPCTFSMPGLWRVAEVLVKHAFDSQVKPHKQGQALYLLQQLYGNKELQEERNTPQAAAVEGELWGKAVKTLRTVQTPINGHFMLGLFKLLQTILQVDKRSSSSSPTLPWDEMRQAVETFRNSISKPALKYFRKEYNVFTEALRGILNTKKIAKSQGGGEVSKGEGGNGVKRGVEKEGEEKERQVKKRRKKEGNQSRNIVTEDGNDGSGKKGKKKKKGKGAREGVDGGIEVGGKTKGEGSEVKEGKKKRKVGVSSEEMGDGKNDEEKKKGKEVISEENEDGGDKEGMNGDIEEEMSELKEKKKKGVVGEEVEDGTDKEGETEMGEVSQIRDKKKKKKKKVVSEEVEGASEDDGENDEEMEDCETERKMDTEDRSADEGKTGMEGSGNKDKKKKKRKKKGVVSEEMEDAEDMRKDEGSEIKDKKRKKGVVSEEIEGTEDNTRGKKEGKSPAVSHVDKLDAIHYRQKGRKELLESVNDAEGSEDVNKEMKVMDAKKTKKRKKKKDNIMDVSLNSDDGKEK